MSFIIESSIGRARQPLDKALLLKKIQLNNLVNCLEMRGQKSKQIVLYEIRRYKSFRFLTIRYKQTTTATTLTLH